MIKHLLSGALLLAFVASCTSEPVTEENAGGGAAKANAGSSAPQPAADQRPTARPGEKLTLTYFNVEG